MTRVALTAGRVIDKYRMNSTADSAAVAIARALAARPRDSCWPTKPVSMLMSPSGSASSTCSRPADQSNGDPLHHPRIARPVPGGHDSWWCTRPAGGKYGRRPRGDRRAGHPLHQILLNAPPTQTGRAARPCRHGALRQLVSPSGAAVSIHGARTPCGVRRPGYHRNRGLRGSRQRLLAACARPDRRGIRPLAGRGGGLRIFPRSYRPGKGDVMRGIPASGAAPAAAATYDSLHRRSAQPPRPPPRPY